MQFDYVNLILRILHLLAAFAAAGGAIYARFALVPVLSSLPVEQRGELQASLAARWSKVVMASIGILLVSGLANFLLFVLGMKQQPWVETWKGTYVLFYHSL
ncbi:MAG: hypothetical protein SFX18_15170, partial [Pirellulales bacterium]|nr:hypothetical protein [Pirellulales bacterium]